MSKYAVAITDWVFPSLDPERQALSTVDAELRAKQCKTVEEIVDLTRDADAVLNCYAKVPAEAISAMQRCRIIARYGIGVDTVDMPAATKAGILVTNVPDYCVEEVSDHAMALVLAVARKVGFSNLRARRGEWSVPATVPIYRLRGRTLGLAGFGKIPRALAPKAQAFGYEVIAFDPYLPADAGASLGVKMVDFDTLLRESDVISVHVPLTPETRHMFDEKALQAMKRTAILVNTSRGPLVKEKALVTALEEGWIAGAALDVVETEPPPADSRLFGFDNLVLTPHIGFYSEQSLQELQRKAVAEVVRVLRGEMPLNLVNRDVVPRFRKG